MLTEYEEKVKDYWKKSNEKNFVRLVQDEGSKDKIDEKI